MTGTLNGAAEPGGVSAPPPAPSPDPGDRGQKFTVTDERSAGDAIAGLLFGGDEDAPSQPPPRPRDEPKPSGGDEPPDTGADEIPPTGDDDRSSGEPQPDAAAIEPPTSWNAEDKQAFAQLPPAMQQTIARREAQRGAALPQKAMEAADSARAALA